MLVLQFVASEQLLSARFIHLRPSPPRKAFLAILAHKGLCDLVSCDFPDLIRRSKYFMSLQNSHRKHSDKRKKSFSLIEAVQPSLVPEYPNT